MPTPKKGPRLASSPAHERLMLANMATSLFEHGRITTTLPKAKRPSSAGRAPDHLRPSAVICTPVAV